MKRWKDVRNNRLKWWDYASDGYYFVTINTGGRLHDFGEVIKGRVMLSNLGLVAKDEWLKTAKIRPYVKLDTYQIMPDHMHGIVHICKTLEASSKPVAPQRPYKHTLQRSYKAPSWPCIDRQRMSEISPVAGSLGEIIRQYKAAVTRYANRINVDFAWQPRYYDRVIRNKGELDRIRKYIKDNPRNWENID